jgi:hypothetical protein
MAGSTSNSQTLTTALTDAITRVISPTLQGIENNGTAEAQVKENIYAYFY